MAAFSIDNLLSKPKQPMNTSLNSEHVSLMNTSMCYPLSIQVAPKTDILPSFGQCQFNSSSMPKLDSQATEILDSSVAVPDHGYLHSAETYSSSKQGNSPRLSTPGSWTEGEANMESQLQRSVDARSPEMETGSGCLSPLQKDEFGQKNIPEPRRMLIKDTNGQIKELIFPRGLDLDRTKRERTSFTPEQLFRLEKEFRQNQYMVGRDRGELANCLGLTETQVKVWFQNRRTKYKREKQREHETKRNDLDAIPNCNMFKILEQSTGQYYTAAGPRIFTSPIQKPLPPNVRSIAHSVFTNNGSVTTANSNAPSFISSYAPPSLHSNPVQFAKPPHRKSTLGNFTFVFLLDGGTELMREN